MTKLYFFWIAEYENKEIFSQYDLNTGKENLYKDVNLKRVKKFGWFPFPLDLKSKIPEAVYNPALPHYLINISPEDTLIVKRRGYIEITGRVQKQYYEYILGTQDYIMSINEKGNVEIRKELN